MTSDLYPTPSRLALLRDVDAGNVFRDRLGDDYISADRKVSDRIGAMERAGWVERFGPTEDRFEHWRVADAGRAVLDSHPEPQP